MPNVGICHNSVYRKRTLAVPRITHLNKMFVIKAEIAEVVSSF